MQECIAPANDAMPPRSQSASLDEALSTLASVLRTMGQMRFPIGEAELDFPDQCEQWARHVMCGGPSPVGAQGDSGRHWRGVREHVRRRRVDERDFIESRIAGFTDVLAEVVSQLHGLTGQSEQATAAIHARMSALGRAADEASHEELRAQVRSTVRGVRNAVENQRSVFCDKVQRLGQRLAAVHDDLGQAREEARLDPMTPLYTGTALEGEIDQGGRVSELSGLPLSLVCLRVDDFELIALNQGLEASNSVLRAVADCVSLCFFRKSDYVARYDDHRFAVLLWDTDLEAAERLAQRLLQKIRRLRVPHEPKPLAVTASIGVCTRSDNEHRAAFIERVLAATDAARIGGGDRRESRR